MREKIAKIIAMPELEGAPDAIEFVWQNMRPERKETVLSIADRILALLVPGDPSVEKIAEILGVNYYELREWLDSRGGE